MKSVAVPPFVSATPQRGSRQRREFRSRRSEAARTRVYLQVATAGSCSEGARRDERWPLACWKVTPERQ